MDLAKIKDKQASTGILDGLFAAANFEGDDDPNDVNDNRALMRYEFFEILVRIAKLKYIGKGLMDNAVARALHRLFNENFLPILSERKLPVW